MNRENLLVEEGQFLLDLLGDIRCPCPIVSLREPRNRSWCRRIHPRHILGSSRGRRSPTLQDEAARLSVHSRFFHHRVAHPRHGRRSGWGEGNLRRLYWHGLRFHLHFLPTEVVGHCLVLEVRYRVTQHWLSRHSVVDRSWLIEMQIQILRIGVNIDGIVAVLVGVLHLRDGFLQRRLLLHQRRSRTDW